MTKTACARTAHKAVDTLQKANIQAFPTLAANNLGFLNNTKTIIALNI
jgi:hypothetical protein